MHELYEKTIAQGKAIFHGTYCLYKCRYPDGTWAVAYDDGPIFLITLFSGPVVSVTEFLASVRAEEKLPTIGPKSITVYFRDGRIAQWQSKWLDVYNFQFGFAVSPDGRYVFAQTWENGLFCLDALTGEKVWRTKSRRGITSIFVCENTILVHQHERMLQLLSLQTGEVLMEKHPATAWCFFAIDRKHIVCQVTQRCWEIFDGRTLEVKQSFSHKEFSGGLEYFCIRGVKRDGQELVIDSFRDAWDRSVSPAKHQPIDRNHRIPIDLEE